MHACRARPRVFLIRASLGGRRCDPATAAAVLPAAVAIAALLCHHLPLPATTTYARCRLLSHFIDAALLGCRMRKRTRRSRSPPAVQVGYERRAAAAAAAAVVSNAARCCTTLEGGSRCSITVLLVMRLCTHSTAWLRTPPRLARPSAACQDVGRRRRATPPARRCCATAQSAVALPATPAPWLPRSWRRTQRLRPSQLSTSCPRAPPTWIS